VVFSSMLFAYVHRLGGERELYWLGVHAPQLPARFPGIRKALVAAREELPLRKVFEGPTATAFRSKFPQASKQA
jgi:hypothetical protein